MTNPSLLSLDLQICHALYSATNALIRAYRPLLEPLDLTYPQYLVMLALWEESELSVTQICQRTRLETGTVTPVLKRLEGKGLIVRGRSETDERQRVISLTEEGITLKQAAQQVPIQMACQQLLTLEHGQEFHQLAQTLYDNLTAADSRTDTKG